MTNLISRTELARNTRKVIEQARRSGPVVVESYGEQQVAVLDVIDYRLLRAAAHHVTRPNVPINDPKAVPAGLTEEEVDTYVAEANGDEQARWDLVIATYLDANISLGRAAKLLRLSRFELQDRLNRLGMPIRTGPQTKDEALREVEAFLQHRE